MLLLLVMMTYHILFTQGGVIQEYPYFSQEVKLVSKEANMQMTNVNKPKLSKNMVHTFDPASMRKLKEYIWIDHQYV